VPFSLPSRQFLTAAQVHLAAAGVVLLLSSNVNTLALRWDLLLWLLLIGFVGFTTSGLALHLFPTVSRHPMPVPGVGHVAFGLAEGGVVLGGAGLSGVAMPSPPGGFFPLGAGLFLAGVGGVCLLFALTLTQPRFETAGPEPRPGDVVTVPLFLASWTSAVGAGVMFVLSGLGPGPGFGWWLAAVHLFVLGHVILLVVAVSLRLVPRSLGADASRSTSYALAGLAGAGAVLVPAGMLTLSPSDASALTWFAAPEAAFALLFVSVLAFLGGRARTPRRELGLQLTSGALLLVGGGLGLWMVSESSYSLVVSHALVNVLGFVGLMVLVEWFGMIAPFQRISHAWTRRMLWALSTVWLVGVVGAATAGAGSTSAPDWLAPLAGGLLLSVAVAWGAGTVPVLYPRLNPIPGLTSEEVRVLRERWRNR
jgi:hypothetical protein